MSHHILVHKITRYSIDELDFDLPDFDAITTTLPTGLYTTFRTYAGLKKVVGLGAHLDRLYLPAKVLGITPAMRKPMDLRELLSNLLRRLDTSEARIRLILDTSLEHGTIYILLQPLQELPDEVYQNGVRVEVSLSSRKKPALKQSSFIGESSFDRKRVGSGIFEILLTRDGRILEGMTSNFFYVRDQALCTAGRGVLIGVTRQMVMALVKEQGIKICSKAIRLNELPFIEEAFITSSSRGIVPVVQIDAQPIANGKVGEMTKRLIRLYEENALRLAEDIL
jgi:branched-chain amino acid aminotransferase